MICMQIYERFFSNRSVCQIFAIVKQQYILMLFKQKFSSTFGRIFQKDFCFDQNSFDLNLTGGTNQAQIIKIQATLKIPEHKGKKIQLQCKWFNKTQKDIVQIPGVTTAYYQPSFIDIGSIIHIQCIPLFPGKQYQGMPIIKQVGPLIVDKQTEQQVNQIIKLKKGTFYIKIMSKKMKDQYQPYKPPQGLLKLSDKHLIIEQRKQNDEGYNVIYGLEINEKYPKYIHNRIESKELKIQLSNEQYVIIHLQDHRLRDTINISSNMILQNKLKKQQNMKQKNIEISNSVQVTQLVREKSQLIQRLNKLQKKLTRQKQDKQQYLRKNKQLQQKIMNINKTNENIQQQLLKLRQQKLKKSDEQTFIINQNIILRKQNQIYKMKQQKYKIQVNQNTQKLQNYQKNYILKEKYRELFQKYTNLQKQYNVNNQKIEYYYNQNQKIKEKQKNYYQKIQALENQVSYLNKKYNVLLEEKSIQYYLPNSNQIKIKNLEKQSLEEAHKQILSLNQQIKIFKIQNQILKNQKNIHKDIMQSSPNKKPKKTQVVEMQKLANRLAETLTEKELALYQMRQINKQLNQKIISLEKSLKQKNQN